jgi:hypothetical protein
MGGEGGMPDVDPLAPIVEITSPEHLDDPNDDVAVLVDSEVEVVCEATQSTEDGSEPVNAATVLLQMLDADGEVVDEKPGVETDTPGEFSAPFILTSMPNGPVSFRCMAADTSEPPLVGSDTNGTFVDHGPGVDVSSPESDSAHSLFGAVSFAFTVTPDPLVTDDEGAEIDTVTLDVVGVRIPLDEQDPGEFRASVNLADTDMFPDTPTTVPVVIRARNIREPARGERVVSYSFVLDGQGPTIVITEPAHEDVVGGEVLLRFTVTDALSEVDEETVAVTINQDDPVYFDPNGPWTRNGDDFVYRFDTTQISDSTAQATINIDARDVAGNASAGEAIALFLDNQPPIVDLDPPYSRELKVSGTENFCSVAFDPVGYLAANDRAPVLQAQRFRALVWADTNHADGQLIHYHSPTDESSVYIYLRDRPSLARPLLVDTDSDGICDEIASGGLPDQRLNPLMAGGQSWFGRVEDEPPNGDPGPAPPAMPSSCGYEDLLSIPDSQCANRSDMRRIISHDMDGKPPVVYAMGNSLGGTGAACTGIEWEITFAAEGWICVAGRATDLVGNVGVSAPLRLCHDDGVDPPPDCSAAPPSCTDGCTIRPVPATGPFHPDWLYDPR